MYASCPKCGHSPLPCEQAFPAACPGCGVILAKIGTVLPQRSAGAQARALELDEDEPGRVALLLEPLTRMPAEDDFTFWNLRAAGLALLALWSFFILKSMDIPEGNSGSNMLHMLLLPFHEAGHVFLRWAGSFLQYLGGTLGQFAMPLGLAIALLVKRGDTYGAALFIWLLGYSLSDTGVYMFDAYDPKMMLLSGYTGAESANHDFIQVFGDLNLLNQSRGIGRTFGAIGRIVMLGSLAWAGWLLWRQRALIRGRISGKELQL